MFEEEQICPYTGLRSFTEEESLYFKGREEDIDRATEQLQRNKFLMLTGASGDGKSSLIYAGIIPNARAGFLKAKYTQWCVADFRPERTPFQNLCKAIARQLDIASQDTVESELNHGFSAITDLYKNSKRHLDVNSVAWQAADDPARAALKREAANLIILVDQFEEFFTNPENYQRGVPSRDANLVLNLLLETARISLEENLPVYVVFTMRSDYIGQCAAFRGLPEYIGFSQFFVPRLNRTQLQQVVEEPAILSGNRITRRLTERLIHDLTEGVDQLPILQHALNQIWHAADNGKEELDLIHYAMVGGMSADELPDDQVDRFKKWFAALSADIKACYHEPNLQNVLDTHTNKLYENANVYYREQTRKEISDATSKLIIKTAFTCLTKIDQSRAVRNRMTLREITNILNQPDCSSEKVGAVLDIFREPGNTFIRPFITDDPESKKLKEDDVLDITHESLIRNWEYLEQWAKEEFDNYAISLDFEQQLKRWVESGKSGNFLLSIGQLTYFETWFKKIKPNAHWIARYLPEESTPEKKLSDARQVLKDSQEFLKKSANKYRVTRAVMRYGVKRIAAVIGLIAILTLSSFVVRDYFRKKNDYVLKQFNSQIIEIANKPKLHLEFSIPPITEALRAKDLTIQEIINSIGSNKQKIRIATGTAFVLVGQGRNEPRNEIMQCLSIADSVFQQLPAPASPAELSEGLTLIHYLNLTSEFACLYNLDRTLQDLLNKNAARASQWVLNILDKQPAGFNEFQMLGLALENAINHKAFSQDEIKKILDIISPFENPARTDWVKANYHRDKLLKRGSYDYTINFNGLYQQLAYLYVASGNTPKALQCVDSILANQQGFSQNDYTFFSDNAQNIAAVYYIYEHKDSVDEFVEGYCQRKKTTAEDFYDRLVAKSQMTINTFHNLNLYTGFVNTSYSNLNLTFQSDSMLAFFYSKLKSEILKLGNADQRNFNLAVASKNIANLFAWRNEMRGEGTRLTEPYYQDALNLYAQVSKNYLGQVISFVGAFQASTLEKPRKFLFLYPDYRTVFHPFEPRSYRVNFNSGSFIDYVISQGKFNELYDTPETLAFFEPWLRDYQETMSSRDMYQRDQMPLELMKKLASALESRNAAAVADLNVLYLHLGNRMFDAGKPKEAIGFMEKIQPEKLLNCFRYYDNFYPNFYSGTLVGKAVAELTFNKRLDLATKLINAFKKEVNRSSLYGYASMLLATKEPGSKLAMQLADSAKAEKDRIDNTSAFQPNRDMLAVALMYIDPEKNRSEANRLIKNSGGNFYAISIFSKAYAFHKKLFKAQQQYPRLMSTEDKSLFLMMTTLGFNKTRSIDPAWSRFDSNLFLFNDIFPNYSDENQ